MKKSEIKKLDLLWSKKIKELANYTCEYCGKSGVWLNACHIIGRRYRGTRWLLSNGMCLCYPHHQQYDSHGPQHEDIVKEVVGKERMKLLIELSKHTITKDQDYEEIKEILQDVR